MSHAILRDASVEGKRGGVTGLAAVSSPPVPTLADYPELVAQLDRKNGRLAPESIAHGSNRRLWWRCPEGRDHVWQAPVANRTLLGAGCGFCAGKRVSVTNSLAKVAPGLARQWHPTKNDPLTARDVVAGSERKVWWKCSEGPDHEWEAPVRGRTRRGAGCGFCAGKRVSVTNSLAKVAPGLARQWHPTKNGALRPRDVVAGSASKVWWKCPKGPEHEWSAALAARVRGSGCPFCSGSRVSAAHNFAVARPEAALEWHPTRNGALRPEDVAAHSTGKVWWRCARGHEWLTSLMTRAHGHGCPFCAGTRVSPEASLAAQDPALAKQWHPTKNGALTPRDVLPGSRRRVWWKCRKGPDHVWDATVANRAGCPICAGRRVTVTTSLAAVHPDSRLRVAPDEERPAHGARRDAALEPAHLVEVPRGPRVAEPDLSPQPWRRLSVLRQPAHLRDQRARGRLPGPRARVAPDEERRPHARRRDPRLQPPRLVALPVRPHVARHRQCAHEPRHRLPALLAEAEAGTPDRVRGRPPRAGAAAVSSFP